MAAAARPGKQGSGSFAKVNYGVLTVPLITAFSIGLMILCKERRIAGVLLSRPLSFAGDARDGSGARC